MHLRSPSAQDRHAFQSKWKNWCSTNEPSKVKGTGEKSVKALSSNSKPACNHLLILAKWLCRRVHFSFQPVSSRESIHHSLQIGRVGQGTLLQLKTSLQSSSHPSKVALQTCAFLFSASIKPREYPSLSSGLYTRNVHERKNYYTARAVRNPRDRHGWLRRYCCADGHRIGLHSAAFRDHHAVCRGSDDLPSQRPGPASHARPLWRDR